jgi:hypothetical protein
LQALIQSQTQKRLVFDEQTVVGAKKLIQFASRVVHKPGQVVMHRLKTVLKPNRQITVGVLGPRLNTEDEQRKPEYENGASFAHESINPVVDTARKTFS